MGKFYEDGFFMVFIEDTGEVIAVCDTVEDADDLIDNSVF
jgi:hypothetical protein